VKIVWELSKPDGQLHKGLNTEHKKEWLGDECRTSLREDMWQTSQRPEVADITAAAGLS
jgi:hypothetical protein